MFSSDQSLGIVWDARNDKNCRRHRTSAFSAICLSETVSVARRPNDSWLGPSPWSVPPVVHRLPLIVTERVGSTYSPVSASRIHADVCLKMLDEFLPGR